MGDWRKLGGDLRRQRREKSLKAMAVCRCKEHRAVYKAGRCKPCYLALLESNKLRGARITHRVDRVPTFEDFERLERER